jgi:hypothetical protein
MRIKAIALAVMIGATSSNAAIVEVENTTTWTGWFSDKGCAESKVKSGNIGPNGTECVKKCLTQGATPVFISEQARAMYEVVDHPGVIEDVGYHVELTGVVDEKAHTIAVRSVKRLAEVPQTCGLPKRKKK